MASVYYTAVLSVIDKISPSLQQLEKALVPVRRVMANVAGIGDGLQRTFAGVGGSLRGAMPAIAGFKGKLTEALSGLDGPAKQAQMVLSKLSGGVQHAFSGMVAPLGSKVIEASAEFERLQTTLEILEGGSGKAKASMDWVADFAAKTPYDLAGVTSAFAHLKTQGIDPQGGALKAAGEAAAAMGVPLDQAAQALSDAMAGSNDSLAQFGISAREAGDQVLYSWRENGQEMTATADKNSREQIQSVVQGIWSSRYGGAMDKMSGTWDGMWASLQETFGRVFLMIGDSGLFDALKYGLASVLEVLGQLEQDGSLKALVQNISEGLGKVIRDLADWIKTVDWKNVLEDMQSFGSRVWKVLDALGGLKTIAIAVAAVFGANLLLSMWSLGSGLVGIGVALGPVGLAIAGIALVIAGVAALIVANWDQIGPWLSGLLDSLVQTFTGAYDVIAGLLSGDFGQVFEGFKGLGGGILSYYQGLLSGFLGLWQWALEGIGGMLGIDMDGVFGAFRALGQGVFDYYKGIIDGFVGMWTTAVEKVQSLMAPLSEGMSWVSDGLGSMLGGEQPAVAAPPGALAGGSRHNLTGSMLVQFAGAPYGTQVQMGRMNQPGVQMEADVGYRSMVMP